MIILAAVLLFVASLTATIGASDIFNSSLYNSTPEIRSAHQYLTTASIIGWSLLAVLVVVFIVAIIAGEFKSSEITDVLKSKEKLTKDDLKKIFKEKEELSSGQKAQIIIIIVLIILTIITLVLGILAVAAAVNLSGSTGDDKIRSAYIQAIISSLAGVGGIGIMIVIIITYFSVRSARKKNLEEIEEEIKEIKTQEKQRSQSPSQKKQRIKSKYGR